MDPNDLPGFDPKNLRRSLELLQALYHNMPPEEYDADGHFDKICKSMDYPAMDFFSALTAASVLAIQLLSEEARNKFFGLLEGKLPE